MIRTLSAAVLALLLVACGGENGGGGGYEDIDAVAKATGCTSTKKEAEPMMLATETATCTMGDGSVTINWFKSNDTRDKYVDVGSSNGAVYVIGDNWAIEAQSQDVQKKLAKSTGGETP